MLIIQKDIANVHRNQDVITRCDKRYTVLFILILPKYAWTCSKCGRLNKTPDSIPAFCSIKEMLNAKTNRFLLETLESYCLSDQAILSQMDWLVPTEKQFHLCTSAIRGQDSVLRAIFLHAEGSTFNLLYLSITNLK